MNFKMCGGLFSFCFLHETIFGNGQQAITHNSLIPAQNLLNIFLSCAYHPQQTQKGAIKLPFLIAINRHHFAALAHLHFARAALSRYYEFATVTPFT